jgi:catechol 2,3-dioxygenase-like lactoylglutathione lyase family enzyme
MATAIRMTTPGIHHVALRVSDYARAKRFYTRDPGVPVLLEVPNLLLFAAGGTAIAIRGPETETPAGDLFTPFRVGLDHIALACTDEGELERVAAALSAAGIENTGRSWTRHLEAIRRVQGSGSDRVGVLHGLTCQRPHESLQLTEPRHRPDPAAWLQPCGLRRLNSGVSWNTRIASCSSSTLARYANAG